jgi:hypothetical protein
MRFGLISLEPAAPYDIWFNDQHNAGSKVGLKNSTFAGVRGDQASVVVSVARDRGTESLCKVSR